MTAPRDLEIALRDMLTYARRGRVLVQGRRHEELDTDPALDLALARALELIGEAARNVPDDVRSRYPEVPWSQWVGLKNILIHAYHRVDLDQGWRISVNELRELISNLEEITEREAPSDSVERHDG
jgi:uncharacterized protein with HEPN domain